MNLRIEHVKHSKCRLDFIRRVKDNAQKRKEAKESGQAVTLKRLPEQPKSSFYVSTKNNKPITISPVPYEALV